MLFYSYAVHYSFLFWLFSLYFLCFSSCCWASASLSVSLCLPFSFSLSFSLLLLLFCSIIFPCLLLRWGWCWFLSLVLSFTFFFFTIASMSNLLASASLLERIRQELSRRGDARVAHQQQTYLKQKVRQYGLKSPQIEALFKEIYKPESDTFSLNVSSSLYLSLSLFFFFHFVWRKKGGCTC